jgi:hypothetical protein
MPVIEATTVEGRKVRRVSVDGRDVTNDCRAFDADAGWVECWDRDERGKLVADRDAVHTYKLFGKVDVEWR